MTKYRRIQHVAHDGILWGASGGYDLEMWTYDQERREPVPSEIPSDARYHSSHIVNSVRYWIYVRRAPMSVEKCERCSERPESI